MFFLQISSHKRENHEHYSNKRYQIINFLSVLSANWWLLQPKRKILIVTLCLPSVVQSYTRKRGHLIHFSKDFLKLGANHCFVIYLCCLTNTSQFCFQIRVTEKVTFHLLFPTFALLQTTTNPRFCTMTVNRGERIVQFTKA